MWQIYRVFIDLNPKNLPWKALRGCTGRTFHTHAVKYTHILMVDRTILILCDVINSQNADRSKRACSGSWSYNSINKMWHTHRKWERHKTTYMWFLWMKKSTNNTVFNQENLKRNMLSCQHTKMRIFWWLCIKNISTRPVTVLFLNEVNATKKRNATKLLFFYLLH